MTASSLTPIRLRLAQLAAHLVVALVALVVIGGATRVMEAGLACPDWPLCYGTLLPGRQMNLQVFLEWFHRLDAFVVGVALMVQLGAVWWYRRDLPGWLLPLSAVLVLMVALQGGLGALTVLQLLPSAVVTAHLALALTLVITVSALTQLLLADASTTAAPLWWLLLGSSACWPCPDKACSGGPHGHLLGISALPGSRCLLSVVALASDGRHTSCAFGAAVRRNGAVERALGSRPVAAAVHGSFFGWHSDRPRRQHVAVGSVSARSHRCSSAGGLPAGGCAGGAHLPDVSLLPPMR